MDYSTWMAQIKAQDETGSNLGEVINQDYMYGLDDIDNVYNADNTDNTNNTGNTDSME